MNECINMCATAQQALKFKELGINQAVSHLYWGFQQAELSTQGEHGYYHLLFFKNDKNEFIFLCPEKNYGHEFNTFSQPLEYAAAYTADLLAKMLDMHLTDIEYDDSGQLLDQVTYQVTSYSQIVHVMSDRLLIKLEIGECTSSQINELLEK